MGWLRLCTKHYATFSNTRTHENIESEATFYFGVERTLAALLTQGITLLVLKFFLLLFLPPAYAPATAGSTSGFTNSPLSSDR